MGRFSIHAAPHNATLSYDKSTDQFTIDIKDIIMVLDDNFDFSGSLPHLGIFNLQSRTHRPDLTPHRAADVIVTNEMFRDYREKNGHGQDMKVMAVSKPVAINKTLTFNAKDYGQ